MSVVVIVKKINGFIALPALKKFKNFWKKIIFKLRNNVIKIRLTCTGGNLKKKKPFFFQIQIY